MPGWRLRLDVDSCDERLLAHLRSIAWDAVASNVSATEEILDERLLELAVEEQRTLYTSNRDDFARLHAAWTRAGKAHFGIIIRIPQWASAEQQFASLMALRNRFGDDISNQLLWAVSR